ncbi:Werner Syndrome-like exonuclease [Glycine soja]
MMQIAIGFDIEWKPTFRKGNNNDVYLINWGGKERDKKKKRTLVDCLDEEFQNSWEAEPLYFVLQIAMWMKVGAGIDGDAVKVFRDYNISVKGVTDLSFHANRKLGGDHKWGLASLTEKLLSKQLKKPNKIRLGNWETPVLSKEQLEYAATDAFASWYLYQISRTPRKSLTEVAKLMVYLKNDYILSVY